MCHVILFIADQRWMVFGFPCPSLTNNFANFSGVTLALDSDSEDDSETEGQQHISDMEKLKALQEGSFRQSNVHSDDDSSDDDQDNDFDEEVKANSSHWTYKESLSGDRKNRTLNIGPLFVRHHCLTFQNWSGRSSRQLQSLEARSFQNSTGVHHGTPAGSPPPIRSNATILPTFSCS